MNYCLDNERTTGVCKTVRPESVSGAGARGRAIQAFRVRAWHRRPGTACPVLEGGRLVPLAVNRTSTRASRKHFSP